MNELYARLQTHCEYVGGVREFCYITFSIGGSLFFLMVPKRLMLFTLKNLNREFGVECNYSSSFIVYDREKAFVNSILTRYRSKIYKQFDEVVILEKRSIKRFLVVD